MLRIESIDIERDQAIGHAEVCPVCTGDGVVRSFGTYRSTGRVSFCDACDGVGFLGVDPRPGTAARPGSNEKIAVLAARCRAGLPLIHEDDDAGRASETSRTESESWKFDDAP